MRLLAYPRYEAMGASSRVRLLQFLPRLASLGIDTAVQPLLPDDYLRDKYAGRSTSGHIARAYLRRAAALPGRQAPAEVVWIEKELWPWAPAWLESAVWGRRPVVLDYDDAIFHNYDLHRLAPVRLAFGRKIDNLMRRAALVVAGNRYLADRARAAGARRVEVLPTVVDLDRYPIADAGRVGAVLRIGWIGSPATVHYLQALAEPLARLARDRALVLRVIGAKVDLPGVPTEHVPWSAEGEARAIAESDIGVMPLPDSPWERGKCGYKLIQYMACALPVVASPVGANQEIVQPGINGFLAADASQWTTAIERLAADAELRRRMGAAGRRAVQQHYCLQVAAPRLGAWLKALAGEVPPRSAGL